MAAVRVPPGGALVAIVRGVLLQIMDVWVWGYRGRGMWACVALECEFILRWILGSGYFLRAREERGWYEHEELVATPSAERAEPAPQAPKDHDRRADTTVMA
jgi:hypothetical protein